MTTTRLSRRIRASRPDVYRALLDADAVRRWMVPDGMTSEVHEFAAHEGGRFRISLTYDEPTTAGKTTAQTDTFHGRFVRLVPDTEVVQAVEFETDDPQMQGEMTITYTLADAPGGTEVVGRHDDVPPGVAPAANELGWRISMDKLAALVEGGG
ncbi:MAG TPA: SRPBCC family protein [Acidimicrobiales bacterium]